MKYTERRYTRTHASVQRDFVQVRDISDTMITLEAQGRQSFVTVLAVEGIAYDLKSPEEQVFLNEQFQALLAGLNYPIQILWRVLPLNLRDYLAQFEVPESMMQDRAIWEMLSSSHRHLFDEMQKRRTLLRRSIFLVIRSRGMGKPQTQAERLVQRRRVSGTQQQEQARQELDLRVGELTRLLDDMNLPVRRLRGRQELTTFVYSCLMPEKADQFPLHADLIDAIDRPVVAPLIPPAPARGVQHETRALVPLEPFSLPRAGGRKRSSRDSEDHLHFTRLADLIAPASLVLSPGFLVVEKTYVRSIAVQNMPRNVFAGWLKPLADLDEAMELSFHFVPQDSAATIQRFRRQYHAHRSSQLVAQSKGNTASPETQIASGDVGELLMRLASGEERALTVTVLILVRASSPRLLEERTARIQSVLYTMLLHARETLFEQDKAFRSCLPYGTCELAGIFLDSRSASTLFPFLSNSLFHEGGILEGVTPQGDPVILDAWGEGMANGNRLVLGAPGGGKSHSIKTMLIRTVMKYRYRQERSASHMLPFQAIIIDPEREFLKTTLRLGGQHIRLAPGSSQHINPFDLARGQVQDADPGHEDRLADHISKLHTLLEIMLADRAPGGGAGTLDSNEHGLLDRALFESYRKVGIVKDRNTHDRPAPLMRDLYEVLEKGDCGPDPTGLVLRLRRYVKGSLSGLFDGPTNIALESMIIDFNLYDLTTELQPVGLFLVSNFVWTQSFASLIPRKLIVDEAATLMEYKSGALFLEDLVRRARKYYLEVDVLSQNALTFLNSAIPANCATQVLMRQSASTLDLVRDMFKLSSREVQLLQHLPIGEALLITNEKRLHVRFEASEVEHLLATTKREEIARWSEEHEGSELYHLLHHLGLLDGDGTPAREEQERARNMHAGMERVSQEQLYSKEVRDGAFLY